MTAVKAWQSRSMHGGRSCHLREQTNIGEDQWLYRRSTKGIGGHSSIGCRKSLLGARAEIEVASLDLGDQIEVEWLPLLGITYVDKNDILEVALEGVDHLNYGPREVWADLNVGEMMSFEVIDDRGVSQIIKLRQPLMLPSPSPPTARD